MTADAPTRRLRPGLPTFISVGAGLYASIGAAVSFLGWPLQVTRLLDWMGTGITMKTNTAILAVIAGAALIVAVLAPRQRMVVRVAAVFVALIGALTLSQHLFGLDFGIDNLLFQELPGSPATVAPNRMGLPASFCFVAIGAALLLHGVSPRARRGTVVLGLLVISIALLSIVGYWYGAENLFAIANLTGIALQSATMIAALGVGLIAACPDREPMRTLAADSNSGMFARRLMPFVLIVPLGLGWLRIEGQRLGLFDAAFGTALRSLIEVLIFGALLWWSLRAIRQREVVQQQVERELRHSERKLAESLLSIREEDRRKDEFIATLAHELRNPLAPIQNGTSILQLKAPLSKELKWAVDVIERQVRHMARLLDDLLDVSRISRGRLELRVERVALEAVVHTAVETSRPNIDAAGHTLEVALPPERIELDADPVRLAQVLSNLLNNAAKFTPKGGQLRLDASATDSEVLVRVQDNGIGIAPDVQPRIFDMFSQAESALTRTRGGLGIGLSLSRGIVELHGGRIDASSPGLGKGSEFVVHLPRTIAAPAGGA